MDGAEERLGEGARRRQTKANALSREEALMGVIEHSKKVADFMLADTAPEILHNSKKISKVINIKKLIQFGTAVVSITAIAAFTLTI